MILYRLKIGKSIKYPGQYKLTLIHGSVYAFADDLMICANNEMKLQEYLTAWELKERNMKINNSKTKVMLIGKQENIRI